MKTFLLILSVYVPAVLCSQTVFINAGSIEFERSINLHKQSPSNSDPDDFSKSITASLEPFLNHPFILYFDSSRVLYKPQNELEGFKFPFLIGPAKENIIFTDYTKQVRQSSKAVFEQQYLVKDSIRNIRWKISGETRTIAGFDCRKAVGIICDSVYVTAFYADEIPVSGGPESFGGLPGMILGIAIPRLHTTWFAKKVTIKSPPENVFVIPSKGKKINMAGLESEIKKSTVNWGEWAQKNIWWTVL